MPFPFLQLPNIVQREITNSLSIYDLVLFALSSKESQRIARKCRLVEKLEWSYCAREGAMLYVIDGQDKSHWHVMIPYPDNLDKERNDCTRGNEYADVYKPVNYNGMNFFISHPIDQCHKDYWMSLDYATATKEFHWDLFKVFTEIFINLFRAQSFDVVIEGRFPSTILDCFLFKMARKFTAFRLHSDGPNVETPEEVQLLLENLQCDEMVLFTHMPKGYKYTKPLTGVKYMRGADWFTLDALLNSTCKQIYVEKDTLTDADFNAVIKKWMDGGLHNLQSLEMEVAPDSDHDCKRILDGIPFVPFDKDNRPQYFRTSNKFRSWDKSIGWDFRRADGTWATLWKGRAWHRDYRIELFVWHQDCTLRNTHFDFNVVLCECK